MIKIIIMGRNKIAESKSIVGVDQRLLLIRIARIYRIISLPSNNKSMDNMLLKLDKKLHRDQYKNWLLRV